MGRKGMAPADGGGRVVADGDIWAVVDNHGNVVSRHLDLCLAQRALVERNRRFRTCDAKATYWTTTDATRAADSASARYGHPMRAYECDRCPGWHLTADATQVEAA